MKKRSTTEIIREILEIANSSDGRGSTKTKIMYGAYLSYASLTEYLFTLIEDGLIDYIPGEKKYKTTKKGIEYLWTIDNPYSIASSQTMSKEITGQS
jgi:predicted transcriptional regulator